MNKRAEGALSDKAAPAKTEAVFVVIGVENGNKAVYNYL